MVSVKAGITRCTGLIMAGCSC